MQTGVASVESSMEFPQKTKNGTAFWPSDSTTGNISKGTQNTNPNEYIHRYVHCGFIYNTQDLEATEVSVDEGIKKLCYIYTMEYYSAVWKKRKSYLFWRHDGPGEHDTKWDKPVRERKTPYDLTYTRNLINKIN